MAIKNPKKWRFTWEAQSHCPTLKLFVFDSYTKPLIQCRDLKVNLNLSQSLVSIAWTQQEHSQNQLALSVPIPKVLIDHESPVSYRALSDHIEVKLVLLLPIDHPIVASSDSVLRLSEDDQISEADVETPLVMVSDTKSLSSKKEGVHFYCRNCSTMLTKRPIRNFVEMPSVNWQEVADNWFGACCCSFGGISEKLVTRYANCYSCVTDVCLLTCTTVSLFKDDLKGCKFPDWDGAPKNQVEVNSGSENDTCESMIHSGSMYGRIAGSDSQCDVISDFREELKFMGPEDKKFSETVQFNEDESNRSSSFSTPTSGLSKNVPSGSGCCVHTTHKFLDHFDEACKHTLTESSSPYQKTNRNMELMADKRSFLNGFLGNIFMARSYNLSKGIEWAEFLCPCCSSLLGAYPCSGGDTPTDGGVRLFKCYISTCIPIGGLGDIFRKYTLEKMFTNQILESAKDELSFRTVVRDLKTKSPMLQTVLLNPNAWCCTGYCLGTDSSVEPILKLDLQPIIKVLFSDCSNNSESQSRVTEDWLAKNLADEVFMLTSQIKELIKLVSPTKDILPPSCTSVEGLPLSSLRR